MNKDIILPNQVLNHSFTNKNGMYKASEVDDFLEHVADSYDKVFRENIELVKKLGILADFVEQYREKERKESFLLTAENKANQIIDESNTCIKETNGVLKFIFKPDEDECAGLIGFFMPIENFARKDFDIVLFGTIKRGAVKVNQSVKVLFSNGTTITALVKGILKNQTKVENAKQGEKVGIVLGGVWQQRFDTAVSVSSSSLA